MTADEQAIRDVVALWHTATAAGDIDTVLTLMDENAIFLVAGQPPMKGRKAFEQGLRKVLSSHTLSSTGEVQEVQASGTLAYCWAFLNVRIVPRSGGDSVARSGNVLSIFRKQPDGAWVLIRDANLLAVA
jgi:uncharacterized protein (TIGR02246 family)